MDEPIREASDENFLFICNEDNDPTTKVIFVKPTTPTHALATRIRALLEEGNHVVTRHMGAGANNQALKAWAIVRQRYSGEGCNLLTAIYFKNVSWNGQPSSALCIQGVRQ